MAVVKRRSKKSTPIRVFRAFALTGIILFIAVVLYEIDAGFRMTRNRHVQSNRNRPSLLSPNVVLDSVNLRHNSENVEEALKEVNDGESSADNEEKIEEEKEEADEVEEKEEEKIIDMSDEKRYYALELANLEGAQSTGEVVLVTHPEWAPIGVEHLHKLLDANFYVDCRFFRVLPDFVVQFGINGDPEVQSEWKKTVLQDDPVKVTNSKGTLTFATSGKNTRTVQLFINKKHNAFLDKQGFSPIAEIISGMEYVDQIYSKAGEKPKQPLIQKEGNAYLNKEFPELSFVKSIRRLTKDEVDRVVATSR